MSVYLNDGEILVDLPHDAATAARVVCIEGSVDLWNYAHPLLALTEIGGSAFLRGYSHALTALTEIGGWAFLRGYAHELPALTRIGESVNLRGYAHALPSLTAIGWDADLRDYAHALPALREIGGRALLHGYAHTPAWIGYVGDDRRGYSFWADLARGRVRAGCRNFTPEEALAHWGPGGPSDRPDCFALAQKAIALLERSKEERS